MPTLVGFQRSTFDPEKYRQSACDNHGQELTTEGICKGIELIAKDISEGGADWLSAMKDTPAYIRSVDGNN